MPDRDRVVGAGIVAGSVAGAWRPEIPPSSKVFRAVNGLPDWLYSPLWAPMQLGNLVVGTLVGLLVALVDRRLAPRRRGAARPPS